MKVAVYYNNKDIRIEEVPKPEIEDGEVLIRVEASGICGSDLMEWYRVPKAPLVLGHEVTGEIVETGCKVKNFKTGDRVVVTHHVPCNTCHFCLTDRHTLCPMIKKTSFDPGGFSEYLRIPEINVDRGMFVLPSEVSFAEGTFTEPLGCVVRGIRNIGFGPGESVAIIGSGVAGLLNLQYIRSLAPGRVYAIDIDEFKLKSAVNFGASYAFNANDNLAAKILETNSEKLCDLVIVCTGVKNAIDQAFEIVEKGGRILFFAPSDPDTVLNIDFNKFWWSGIKIVSSYAASPKDMALALELIKNKRVDIEKMITHRLPLSEIKMGFDLASSQSESLKIIINPHS
ncbi:MAG: alcohol dehydrogenase catalytic domain-containing protein [Thermodesulfobacteriota bacterium]